LTFVYIFILLLEQDKEEEEEVEEVTEGKNSLNNVPQRGHFLYGAVLSTESRTKISEYENPYSVRNVLSFV